MRLLSSAIRSVPAASVLLLVCAVSARAQTAQPRAELSRFEIGAYVSSRQTDESVGGERKWKGPGQAIEFNANVNVRFSVATIVETYFDGTVAALAGVQVCPNMHDPLPTRFFAKALAGAVRERSGGTRPALYLGAGADTILIGTRGLG